MDEYGVKTAPDTLRIERTLPGPIERVWTYLTDPAKRATWFARGPMELIILNIGLQRGLINPMLFTVMVMMTLVTTMAAGPLFEWAWRGSAEVTDGVRVPVR